MLGSLFLMLALSWLANGDGPQNPDPIIQATYLVGEDEDGLLHIGVGGCPLLQPPDEACWDDEEICSGELTPEKPKRNVVIEVHVLNVPADLAGKIGTFITGDQAKSLTMEDDGFGRFTLRQCVISRPTVRATSGQEVKLTVIPSERIPYVSSTTLYLNDIVVPGLDGLSFRFKPRVSADDRFVRLDLEGTTSLCPGGNCTGITQTCTSQMQAVLPDGKTVVLRGLTYPAESCSEIPVLADIPLVGELFKTHCVAQSVVMLATVHIMDGEGHPVAQTNCTRECPLVSPPCSCCEPPAFATVEDNLEKLQMAKDLYNLANLYERLNEPAVASKILCNVQEVCPGSRIASEAISHCDSLALKVTPPASNLPVIAVVQPTPCCQTSAYSPVLAAMQAVPCCQTPPRGPNEGAKVVQNAYIIEPPDLLTVELFKGLPDYPLSGERLVRTDGSIDLGFYGSVTVAGLTIDQARKRVQEYLSTTINNPKVHLDVYSYNSKGYYVIADGAGQGEQTVRLPYTGNETVLDAIAQIGGLPPTSDKTRVWLARPGTGVMPIDWNGIVKAGDPTTNYQMQPSDRIYIAADPKLCELVARQKEKVAAELDTAAQLKQAKQLREGPKWSEIWGFTPYTFVTPQGIFVTPQGIPVAPGFPVAPGLQCPTPPEQSVASGKPVVGLTPVPLRLTGGEEAETPTPAKDTKLNRIMTSYRHACKDGNVDLARQLAIEALAIDPTCFGK